MARLIDLTSLCQSLHCLPREGGLYDQDPYLVEGMRLVLAAQKEKADKDAPRKRK